jgi:hypothetical protein
MINHDLARATVRRILPSLPDLIRQSIFFE